MRKAVRYCSVLCGITAVIALVFGIRAISGNGFFVGLRIFNIAESGTFMGVIGNFMGMAVTCMGFGTMAVCGLKEDHNARRKGFLCGLVITALSVISAIAAVFTGHFTIGDLLIALLPAIYTYGMLNKDRY